MPSIKELRAICQNSKQAPSWASQTVFGKLNRRWAIYLTWVFIHLPFTPNQVTVAGTVVYLLGAACFLGGTRWWSLAGIGLIIFSFVLDAVDGELARYRAHVKGETGRRFDMGGVFVEPVSHDVQYGWVFLPITLGVFWQTGSSWAIVAGFAATAGKLLFRLLEFRSDAFRRYADETRGTVYGWATKKSTPKTAAYGIYRNLFVGTGMIPPLLVASIADRVDIFLYAYGVLFFSAWAALMIRNTRRVLAASKDRQATREGHALFKAKVVIFDFDGTLVDTMGEFANIAAAVMTEFYGAETARARERYMETSGVPFLQQLGVIYPGDARNPKAAEAFEHRKNIFFETFTVPEETRRVVAELTARGLVVGVSSNNFQASVDRFVERERMTFAHVMGFRENFRKGEQHIAYIRERTGTTPEEIVLVGDSFHDAEIARGNGIGFVAKAGTFSVAAWKDRFPHVVAVSDLRELPALLAAPSPELKGGAKKPSPDSYA